MEESARLVKSLRANLFAPVAFVASAAEATQRALEIIPQAATVGVGGSTTIWQVGLVPELEARGTEVLDTSKHSDLPFEERARKIVRSSDVFLASCNALTMDGKLVNIDGAGNRVSGTIFGPKSVVLIVGVNKIVRNVEEALDRTKNVIAPYHNFARGRKVPCAVTMRCTDCDSPDRTCRVTAIIEKKPRFTDIAVIIVGEDLGLGWDPTWPRERIDRIAATYQALVHRATDTSPIKR